MDLRDEIVRTADSMNLAIVDGGTYAVTQGPRLETAAEIDRIDRDGGHYVGMTLMPEACLAKELNLSYAAICQVVNPAAGRGASANSVEIASNDEKLNKVTDQCVDLAIKTFLELNR